ncbi:MAG: SRPBCC domain-containing protein [Thermomicrobiales bacterium]
MTDPAMSGFVIGSFRIEQVHQIAAPVSVVFAFLTNRRAPCWLSIFSGHGGEMRIEPRPGGAVGEFWGEGDFFLWGTVTEVETDRTLTWAGPNGMQGAIVGTTRFTLTPTEDGATILQLSHHAFGEVGPDDEQRFGEGGGWTMLIGNLRRLAESASH